MPLFTFIVGVECDTLEHAQDVMAGRIGPDEEIEDEQGEFFDYKVDWKAQDSAATWRSDMGYTEDQAFWDSLDAVDVDEWPELWSDPPRGWEP